MYGLEIREPERAVFGTGIQRRRLFGNGIQGRPTLDHKQLGIQRRPLCTRGSREDPKKTGIQGRPPGDPATTFYHVREVTAAELNLGQAQIKRPAD